MLIKSTGVVVFGMRHDGANAHDIGGGNYAA